MSDQRRMMIETVAAALRGRDVGHPLRVGIDGVCGAGKSTFARELTEAIAAGGGVVVHVDSDGFHHVRERRHRHDDAARGYYEDAYDFDSLVNKVLEPLGPGGSRTYATRVHDLVSDEVIAGEVGEAASVAIVLFDATFIQRGSLREMWDEVIYLAVPEAVAIKRGVTRDTTSLGGESSARDAYEARYMAACRIYLREEDPATKASIVIDNADTQRPDILRIANPVDCIRPLGSSA